MDNSNCCVENHVERQTVSQLEPFALRLSTRMDGLDPYAFCTAVLSSEEGLGMLVGDGRVVCAIVFGGGECRGMICCGSRTVGVSEGAKKIIRK
jgi:hypothetical protein